MATVASCPTPMVAPVAAADSSSGTPPLQKQWSYPGSEPPDTSSRLREAGVQQALGTHSHRELEIGAADDLGHTADSPSHCLELTGDPAPHPPPRKSPLPPRQAPRGQWGPGPRLSPQSGGSQATECGLPRRRLRHQRLRDAKPPSTPARDAFANPKKTGQRPGRGPWLQPPRTGAADQPLPTASRRRRPAGRRASPLRFQ